MSNELKAFPSPQIILDILAEWHDHGYFDGVWYGYNTLHDEILTRSGVDYKMNNIKYAMKKLRREDAVSLQPTYTEEGIICGSGYFITEAMLKVREQS